MSGIGPLHFLCMWYWSSAFFCLCVFVYSVAGTWHFCMCWSLAFLCVVLVFGIFIMDGIGPWHFCVCVVLVLCIVLCMW